MSNPILALAAVRRRLAKRTAFTPGPPAEAVAAALRAAIAEAELVRTGKACRVPQPADDTQLSPAKAAVHATLDRMHKALMAAEREAAQAKRQAKLARRAARGAAQSAEPVPAAEQGQQNESVPAPAVAGHAPVAHDAKPETAKTVSMSSLMY